MEIHEFEKQMKTILQKAGEASDMTFDWMIVSGDPDCVADFGCDYEGNLVIAGDSFYLKIADITHIRYRWNENTDSSDCFYRFDFGECNFLDCCFDDCTTGEMYHVKYDDIYKTCLSKEEAIALMKQCVNID